MPTVPSVSDFMTIAPHTIGLEQSIERARERMATLGVRHLPVLEGGALRGIVSERDLGLVVAAPGFDPTRVTVEDAMTPEPYVASPRDSLSDVAAHMGRHRYGAAVIVEHGKVVGVFTATDALLALSAVLEGMVHR
ncbi:MAG: CBS domain-containing protein, partial [Myxococcales bacterium]|nr:CBS domain-containing protein [Myxococcales bacterium]